MYKDEYFEISWDDAGNRRIVTGDNETLAQEVAAGFVNVHRLNDVQIHKVTITREQVKVQQ